MSMCPNCRIEIQPGLASCPNCGAQIGAPPGMPGGYGQPAMGGYGQPQVGFGPPPIGSSAVSISVIPAYILSAIWLLFCPILGGLFFYLAATAKQDAERGEADKARKKLKGVYITTGVLWGLGVIAGLLMLVLIATGNF